MRKKIYKGSFASLWAIVGLSNLGLRLGKFICAVLAALFVVFIILLSFRLLVFSPSVYYLIQSRSGVYQDLDAYVVKDYTNNLIGYFRGYNELDGNFYSKQAVFHLKDVKDLINSSTSLLYTITIILVFALLIFIVKRQTISLLRFVRRFGLYLLVFWVILFPLTLVGFGSIFFAFHKVLFSNDLWLFSAGDTLIILFPEKFFILYSLLLVALSFVITLLFWLAAVLLLKYDKRI